MVKSHNCVFKATMLFMIGGGRRETDVANSNKNLPATMTIRLEFKKKNHFPNKCKPSRLKIFHCDWVWNSLTAFGNPKKHPPPPKAAHP